MPMHHNQAHLLSHKNFFRCSVITSTIYVFLCLLLGSAHAQMQELKDTYDRAVTAYNNHQYGQSISLYQQIIKIAPTFAAAYNGMALANQASGGDEDNTIQYLKTAISYDPKMLQAYDNLGRIYYDRQDIDSAQEYFEKALKIDPNLSSAQLSLAWINLLARSKPEIALKYFKKVSTVSQDPKIYYGMGSAYFANNQRAEALEIITKLHQMGEEDLASRLEASMRDNAHVNTQSDADNNPSENASSAPAGLGPLDPTPDKPTGMQARLRGKLSDY